MDDSAVGVELRGRVAGVVGELLDQVLLALAQFVLGEARDGEFERAEDELRSEEHTSELQ